MTGSVRKRGNTYYYSFFMGTVDGKKKYKEKGGFIKSGDADKALRKAIKEFEDGVTIEVNNISMADYLDYWYKNYVMANLKYRSQQRYANEIKNHLKPYFGNYRLQSINHLMIQEFLTSLVDKKMAKTTIKGIYGVFSKAIIDAYKTDMLKVNPLDKVTIPKVSKKANVQPFTNEQLKTIIERIKDTHYYLPFMIGLCTGLRVGEVCGLQWDDIDTDGNIIHIHRMIQLQNSKWVYIDPKTETTLRAIEIPKMLSDMFKLELEKQKSNKIKYDTFYKDEFSKAVLRKENGELITPETMKWLSDIVNKKLNIPYKFHWLRHTKVSMMLDANIPIKEVQAIIGHSDTKTTLDVYGHLIKNKQSKSTQVTNKLLKKILPFSE